MKITYCLITATMLLCGCSQKPDAKVAALEQKISVLESNVTDLYERNTYRRQEITNIWEMTSNSIATGSSNLDLTLQLDALILEHESKIQTLALAVSNAVTAINWSHGASVPVRQMPATQPGQMPASVAAQIRAEAAREWPGDYSMQNFEIKKETEAWYELNRAK